MPKKCPPGVICIETTTILIFLAIFAFVFVLYVFRINPLNAMTNPSKNNANSNANNNVPRVDANVKLTIDNVNHPDVSPSYKGYLTDKSHERTVNPLLPPERSFEQTYGIPINVPTRGYSGGYQQVGMLYKESVQSESINPGNNSNVAILPLYGRPVHPGSNKWSYYTASDKYNMIKIPFSHKGRQCDNEYGCEEIYDDDLIDVPAYNGQFRAKIYGYDKPRYIPYLV